VQFDIPISVNLFFAQFAALLYSWEPVNRGPYTSAIHDRISFACERFIPFVTDLCHHGAVRFFLRGDELDAQQQRNELDWSVSCFSSKND
jgi:hypothetical protein